MKLHLLPNLVLALIISVIGYFLLPGLSEAITPQIAFIIGVLVGALLIPVLARSFSGQSESAEDNGTSASTTQSGTTTLYVGNLPYRANENAVMEHFAKLGHVESVRLMKDRRTGKRKGYGFVEMAKEDASHAIDTLNDSEFQERTLKVRLAKEKVQG